MKKILVAIATAALAVTGFATPASAAVITDATAGANFTVAVSANNDVFTLTCTGGNWGGTPNGSGGYVAIAHYGSVMANSIGMNGNNLSVSLSGSSLTLTQSYNAGLMGWTDWGIWFNSTALTCNGNTFASSVFINITLNIPTYVVTYDANGGSGSITASSAQGARALSNGSGFTRSGYNFTGWNTAANGTGTAIAGGASYTPSGNVTVYAQWVQAAQTVTYDANTGTGAIAASVANGARNLADGSALSRSGYTFAGWNTAANGTGTSIAGGASYTPSGNVTLYAQWNRIPTPAAPVFTSPISVAPTGGVLNLTGANLANITSITIDDIPATVASSASGEVSVKLPTLAPGKYDITIKNADGGIRFIDGLVVPDPNAKVAPKPTNTYVAGTAIKVAGGNVSAKQATALTQFVAQYKTAKQATVFIRTSKAGLPAAKKAAAAMLATVVKTLKNVKTGIVVDSTSETTTALDLVVTD
ncbi:MAG: hypothetical protein RL016_407 [Actinomycetota bacterium]|mgnify:CR=1 FL=1|jgi:uncharacterized repeat protein (TIGR02543 family)